MRLRLIVVGVVVAAVIVVVVRFWLETGGSKPETATDPPVQGETARPEQVVAPALTQQPVPFAQQSNTKEKQDSAAPESAVDLPELGASDAFVLEQIKEWPLPAAWLQREELLARLATVLLSATEGRIPRSQVDFLAPADAYPVLREGEQYFVDAEGYSRYDPYLDVLEAIEPVDLAELLMMLDPLMTQALVQLGEQRSTAALIVDCIARVEALPVLPVTLELLRPGVLYIYADPALEALPEFEKQMLRMGPMNLSRLKSYLAEFKDVYDVN